MALEHLTLARGRTGRPRANQDGPSQTISAFPPSSPRQCTSGCAEKSFEGGTAPAESRIVEERMYRLGQKTPFLSSTVKKAWESGLQAPQDEAPTWIHGDLHPQNVLVKKGSIRCVIDWADMARGDRATDLASIWMLLPSVASRASAIAEYGSIASANWCRAIGWAVLFGVLLLETGLADNPRHAKIGELTLRRIAEGPH